MTCMQMRLSLALLCIFNIYYLVDSHPNENLRKITTLEYSENLLLNTRDLLNELDSALRDGKPLSIRDAELNLKLVGKEESKPVYFLNGKDLVTISDKAEHEFYHDAKNNAAFTISKFRDEGGNVERVVRGNIFYGNNEELVVEPQFRKFGDAKRELQDNEGYTRIFRRKIEGLENRAIKNDYLTLSAEKVAKRQLETKGPKNNYVEVLGLVDYSFYEQVNEMLVGQPQRVVATFIEAYYAQINNIANLIYRRSLAKSELNLELVLTSFVVLTTPDASYFTSSPEVSLGDFDEYNREFIDAPSALNSFNQWLLDQRGINIPESFDLAVALTNQNLWQDQTDLLGIALIGGTCKYGSNGIIVENPDQLFYSASTYAHEIAHNLGLDHDGVGENVGCPDELNFVMSTSNVLNYVNNSYFFSECSIRKLEEIILKNNQLPCLANQVEQDEDVIRFASYYPGQLFDIDSQCKLIYGDDFYPATGRTRDGKRIEDLLCEMLYCTENGRHFKASFPALEKSSCGDGKWCEESRCVENPNAPKGQCLIVDDFEFCMSMKPSIACNNFNTGKCCQYCNPGAKFIRPYANYTVPAWLSKNIKNNLKYIAHLEETTCEDKDPDWCSMVFEFFEEESVKTVCNWTVENILVKENCRQSCSVC